MQHADSQDVIAAQLRDLAPRRSHNPTDLNVASKASPKPASEPSFRATPLNDNTSDMRIPMPRAVSRRRRPIGRLRRHCRNDGLACLW